MSAETEGSPSSGEPETAPARSEDEVFEEYLGRINAGVPLDREEIERLYPAFAGRLIADLELYDTDSLGLPPRKLEGGEGHER